MSMGPRSLDQRAVELAKDALYVSVGFGVLAVQRALVQRRALHGAVERRLSAAPLPLTNLVRRQPPEPEHRSG